MKKVPPKMTNYCYLSNKSIFLEGEMVIRNEAAMPLKMFSEFNFFLSFLGMIDSNDACQGNLQASMG